MSTESNSFWKIVKWFFVTFIAAYLGAVIALDVSNRNDRKTLRIEEVKFKELFINDLCNDIEGLNSTIDFDSKSKQAAVRFFCCYENISCHSDFNGKDLAKVTATGSFKANYSTYQLLQQHKDIFNSNIELKSTIFNYYDTAQRYRDNEQFRLNGFYSDFRFETFSNSELYFDAQFDIEKLLNGKHQQYVNYIRAAYSGLTLELEMYEKLRTKAFNLIDLLEKEV